MSDSDIRINGGFFVCRRELLGCIEPGDELVEETFSRLIPRGEVVAFPNTKASSAQWTRSRIDSGSSLSSSPAGTLALVGASVNDEPRPS